MMGEDHVLVGKLIQIGCGELLLARPLILPKHTDITGAHIVTEDENDIGLRQAHLRWLISRHEGAGKHEA
jgi:hypothetical protein